MAIQLVREYPRLSFEELRWSTYCPDGCPQLSSLPALFQVPSFPITSFHAQPSPWSDSVPQLCFEPEPDADTPEGFVSEAWWRRLEHMGLSPGNVAINRAESNSLAAIGRERRHSV